MTLYDLVVAAGALLSAALAAVLTSLWPARPERPVLCFKPRPDAACTPACLRECPLLA